MTFVIRWLVLAAALAVAVWLIPGLDYRDNTALAVAALVLGLVNAFLRPLLFWMTLPLTVLSLGFFLLVLNAAMLGLVGWLVPGFTVSGFLPALFGAIVVGATSLLLNRFVRA